MFTVERKGFNHESADAFCTDGEQQWMVSVYYTRGGYSFISGESSRRGFYVSLTPCKYDNMSFQYSAFSGYKTLLEEASRFNKKKLQSLVEEVFSNLDTHPELQKMYQALKAVPA
jgi:hypothetical protein